MMVDYLFQIFPEPKVIGIITPLTIVSIFFFLYVSGTLKLNYKIKTNYTRKLFHILVFTLAGIIGYFYGQMAVMFYGGITGLIMIYIIYLSDGYLLFEGVAREQDNPHRSFYIGVPFICTAMGGLFNSFIFGQFAIVGYFVAGWGDAIGEPIGVRFGKHKYNVPSFQDVKCQRSVEGSIAVFIMSYFAVWVGLSTIGGLSCLEIILASILAGIGTSIIEAGSPHGIDNFTTQVTAVVICVGVFSMGL
jgi:phytol kinase